jgi:hypothetical protein
VEVLHDFGVNMERHPTTYEDKDEEALRDLFLMLLSPHFHSVTGETFNKRGKTDILIIHEGGIVFVAECKIWRGGKAHAAAIDQVLGYLTWRESKVALLLFIRNRELAPIVRAVDEATRQHKACIRADGEEARGVLRYRFHLPEDATASVQLTLLCFHLPEGGIPPEPGGAIEQ